MSDSVIRQFFSQQSSNHQVVTNAKGVRFLGVLGGLVVCFVSIENGGMRFAFPPYEPFFE